MPKKPPSVKSFTIAILRRGSYRWPARNEAFKKARIGRNQYRCVSCGTKKIYQRNMIQIDHILPVVDVEKGFTNFEDYINRLYCPANGFQILCLKHHDEKTAAEKELRKKAKADAKKEQEHKDLEKLEKIFRGDKRKGRRK